MKTGLFIASTVILLAAGASSAVMAATSRPHTAPLKHARPGEPLLLATDYDLDRNCKAITGVKVVVITPPSHGTLKVLDHLAFTHYPHSNIRYKCNKTQSQMLATFYTSGPGYVGKDHVAVRIVSPLGGTAPVYAYDISVQ
jgi:hypothetical protein